MKYTMAATFMAFGLTACGGGGGDSADDTGRASSGGSAAMQAEFVDQCVEETDQSREACACQMDAMVDAVGSDTFEEVVRLAQAGDEAGAERVMTEKIEENPMAGLSMAAAMIACTDG